MAIYAPKQVPANWFKYEVSFSLQLLDSFIETTESQIDLSIFEFSNKIGTEQIGDLASLEESNIVEIHKGLDDSTYDLKGIFNEYFPSLQRRSAFLTLYGFLEHELDRLCLIFKNNLNERIGHRDLKDLGIERSIKYLTLVANLDFDKSKSEWGAIKSIQKIRNNFVHNDGKLTDLDGNIKNAESQYVASNPYLAGSKEIEVKKGFLSFVLEKFLEFFQYIDQLIQNQIAKNK